MKLIDISFLLVTASALPSFAVPFSLKNFPISDRSSLSMVGNANGDVISLYSFSGAAPKSPDQKRLKVYIQSNLHGNEGLTRTVSQFLMNRLLANTGPLYQLSRQGVSFDFVPVANPTGARLVTRHNSADFDLNRNFSQFWNPKSLAPGSGPFSERETQTIRSLFQENLYDVAIDIHGFVNWVVTPSFNPDIPMSSKNQKLARWRSSLTKNLPLLNRESRIVSALELGDGGAFEDWAYWDRNALAYCLEIDHPLGTGMNSKAWTEQMKAYESYIAESIAIAGNGF